MDPVSIARQHFPDVNFRDYQSSAVDFGVNKKRILLADAMGLGKTRSALATGLILMPEMYRRLIVCSKSALVPWQNEHERYFPEHFNNLLVLEGQPKEREYVWKEFRDRFNRAPVSLLTSYGILHQDLENFPLSWDHMDVDEAHKIMNRKTEGFKDVKKIQAESTVMISGTPADRGPEEMFAYFNILYPKQYPNYWPFINKFCHMEKGPFGMENWGPKNLPDFKARLRNFMIRRTKSQVAHELPAKMRLPLYAKMSPSQEKIYAELNEHMIVAINDRFILTPTTLAKTTRLRQLLACPKAMDPTLDVGAGVEAIVQHVLDNEITHPVIMCPFPSLFPFMEEYLRKVLKMESFILRGGMDSKQVRKVIASFEQCKRGFVLLSIKFAQSFDLTKSHTGYMLGYEYRKLDNEQAEDRLHRLSSTEPVSIYYLILRHANGTKTADEDILEILDGKKRNTEPFLNDDYDLAQQLFVPR